LFDLLISKNKKIIKCKKIEHILELHGKNDFPERSKILAGYRSEK